MAQEGRAVRCREVLGRKSGREVSTRRRVLAERGELFQVAARALPPVAGQREVTGVRRHRRVLRGVALEDLDDLPGLSVEEVRDLPRAALEAHDEPLPVNLERHGDPGGETRTPA